MTFTIAFSVTLQIMIIILFGQLFTFRKQVNDNLKQIQIVVAFLDFFVIVLKPACHFNSVFCHAFKSSNSPFTLL